MKKAFPIFSLLLVLALFSFAQTTQLGYAKAKGRMDSKGNLIPGTRIGGVAIQLTGGHSTVTDANGNFTLTAPDKKFYLSDVQKQGYVLTDPEMLKKQYVCSGNPLVISMETPSQQQAEAVLAADIEELGRRCYSFYEKFASQFENDSAFHYLMMRAALDTTKVEWQLDAGSFMLNYMAGYKHALVYYQRALRHALSQYGESHPYVMMCYNNIAIVYSHIGEYERALNYHQKSLTLRKSVLGENHIDVAASYLNMGTVYANVEDFEPASECFQKALAIQKTIYGEKHPDVAEIYNNLGLVYSSLGKYTRALEYTQKSLDIMKAFFGESHPNVAQIYGSIGVVYYNQGDYPHALEY